MANEPMIKLEPGGRAPILSYNVPEPTSYSGRHMIEIEFPATHFKPEVSRKPPDSVRPPVKDQDPASIKTAIMTGMKTGFADSRLFPNIRGATGLLRFAERPNPGLIPAANVPVNSKLAQLDPDEVAANLQYGKRLNLYRSIFGTLTYNYVTEPTIARPRIYLIEVYGLSSFLGGYGAGRVLKTFSLLPGEATKISVKTYAKRETDAKSASSILDSFTQESADDFETSLQAEQSDKQNYNDTFEYHAEAEAHASWGFGSAKVSGGVKGGTSSAREEFAKNVSNAAQKHAMKASAKRDIQVNTSYEVREETGEETSIERQVSNTNLSRTLNFVFRQMNQEFTTLLHLADVRVGFFNGFAESKREVAIGQLDSLLDEVIIDDARRTEVRSVIFAQLNSIVDHKDTIQSIVEEKTIVGEDKYFRIRRDLTSTYHDPATGADTPPVQGLILKVIKSVLRTDGVIVDSLLGEGEALDDYATQLQELEIQRRRVEIGKLTAEQKQAELLNQVVQEGDVTRSKLLTDLTCCGRSQSPTLRVDLRKVSEEDGNVRSRSAP